MGLELTWLLCKLFELFMKLPWLCFFRHMGLTEILDFLGDDTLLDDIEKEEGYAMTMDGGSEGLSIGGRLQE